MIKRWLLVYCAGLVCLGLALAFTPRPPSPWSLATAVALTSIAPEAGAASAVPRVLWTSHVSEAALAEGIGPIYTPLSEASAPLMTYRHDDLGGLIVGPGIGLSWQEAPVSSAQLWFADDEGAYALWVELPDRSRSPRGCPVARGRLQLHGVPS